MKAMEINKENDRSKAGKEKEALDEFRIPNEAACSSEFDKGCILVE